MALGSTQPLTVPGAFPGGKGGRCVRLTTLPSSCAVVMKSGNLNFPEPSGPLQALYLIQNFTKIRLVGADRRMDRREEAKRCFSRLYAKAPKYGILIYTSTKNLKFGISIHTSKCRIIQDS